MQIYQGRRDGPSRQGDAKMFTGIVRLDTVAAEDDGSVSIYDVNFEPGARTFWHRHPGGQVILVRAGEGRVQARGGDIHRIRSGDVIHAAPGEEHWHGGGEASYVVHTAISIGVTEWAGEATDAEVTASNVVE